MLKDNQKRFGSISIFIHWASALLITGLISVGLYMTDREFSPTILKLYGLHKSFGVLLLFAVAIRILWRFANKFPNLPADMKKIEIFAAKLVHLGLYSLIIVMPLSGWAMSSAAGFSVSFFGIFTMPNFVQPNPELFQILKLTHKFSAYVLIVAVCGHASAAFMHHFIRKDNVLLQMLPNFLKKND